MSLSLKCLLLAAKAHSGCPCHKGYKPQKNYQKIQRINACLYLIHMGFSEYYGGQIKIFTDLKARNYLSFYKKDYSESY